MIKFHFFLDSKFIIIQMYNQGTPDYNNVESSRERSFVFEASNKHYKPKRTSTRLSLLYDTKMPRNLTKFQRSSTPRILLKLKKNILTSTVIETKHLESTLCNISAIQERNSTHVTKRKRCHKISNIQRLKRQKIHAKDNSCVVFDTCQASSGYLKGEYKIWIL